MMAANARPFGRSKGAVIFATRAETQAELAAKLRVSQPTIALWRSGQRTPYLANRKLIASKFKIPIEAWDEPPETPEPWGEAAATGRVEMLESMASKAEAELATGAGMTFMERIKNMEALTRVVAEIRKLRGEDISEIDVLAHPKWREVEALLFQVLEAHPEAFARFLEGLRRLRGEQSP